jgi:hypothetical protein
LQEGVAFECDLDHSTRAGKLTSQALERNAVGGMFSPQRINSMFCDPAVPRARGLAADSASAIDRGMRRSAFYGDCASSALLAIQNLQGHTFLPSSFGPNTGCATASGDRGL